MLELHIEKPNSMIMRSVETVPSLMDDEVKLEIMYGGICGSDLSVLKGKIKHAIYPIRPGHELLGKITEAGSKSGLDVGTKVIVVPNTYCRECKYCLGGKRNICQHKKSFGININGGFSEEMIIPAKYVMPVPDDISDEEAILIEPFSVIIHAFRKINVTKGSSVAVVGCGTEGMLATILAKHLGANVTAIDINTKKLDLVEELGAVRSVQHEDIEGETFDIVIEAAGTKKSVEQGIQLVDSGGTLVLVGITEEANLPVAHVVRSEITIYGSIIYDVPEDFQAAIEYLRDPEFDVRPVISDIIPFKEYTKAFERALTGDFGKIVIDFKQEVI
ncbi:zinc-dependent alcohol dehydrogenase [Bacillus horti]|uniref:L-iditol 2-dehydrogenase n=1 Tax=Caldalkalibacillus horti TaxID=77523 RepID=A0ABT9W143_9BACI|nr:alcohol dehydrogenase catalytic domain-containing protein [Bacillus horti]MDQ0166987.1 L-iditol 2-dehydrogenase [Bacillus horti]